MKTPKIAIVLAAVAPLGACAQLEAVVRSPDTVGCAAALIASGQRSVDGLRATARTAPACLALRDELIQMAIREAMLRIARPLDGPIDPR